MNADLQQRATAALEARLYELGVEAANFYDRHGDLNIAGDAEAGVSFALYYAQYAAMVGHTPGLREQAIVQLDNLLRAARAGEDVVLLKLVQE